MNVSEIAEAMIKLAENPQLVREMGEIGYKRVVKSYRIEQMKETYEGIYKELGQKYGCTWSDAKFTIEE